MARQASVISRLIELLSSLLCRNNGFEMKNSIPSLPSIAQVKLTNSSTYFHHSFLMYKPLVTQPENFWMPDNENPFMLKKKKTKKPTTQLIIAVSWVLTGFDNSSDKHSGFATDGLLCALEKRKSIELLEYILSFLILIFKWSNFH